MKIIITKVLNDIMKVGELPERRQVLNAEPRSLRPPKIRGRRKGDSSKGMQK